MLSKPERKGYVLTEWGEDVYSEWQDIGGGNHSYSQNMMIAGEDLKDCLLVNGRRR